MPDDSIERVVRDLMDLPESDGELADPLMVEESLGELELEMDALELALNGDEAEEMPKSPPPSAEEVEASYMADSGLKASELLALYGYEVHKMMKKLKGGGMMKMMKQMKGIPGMGGMMPTNGDDFPF